jgi:peptidoglycan/xylan/chitin deacetylase (PgdA/CDA1 family)
MNRNSDFSAATPAGARELIGDLAQKTRAPIRMLAGGMLHYSGLLDLMARRRKHLGGVGRFLILMYHRVAPAGYGWSAPPVTPRQFDQQLEFLRWHWEVLSLDAICERLQARKTPARDCVAITFDDGYQDNYKYAYPLLRKHSLPATIFLATGHVGSALGFWWDRLSRLAMTVMYHGPVLKLDQRYPVDFQAAWLGIATEPWNRAAAWVHMAEAALKRLPVNQVNSLLSDLELALDSYQAAVPPLPQSLNWNQVREMHNHGIDFGGHTVKHAILTRLSREEARIEISGCRAELEGELGKPVRHFSYPNGQEGDYNPEIKTLVAENHFISACTSLHGANDPQADLFALNRFGVTNAPLCVLTLRLAGLRSNRLHAVMAEA